MQLDAYSYDIAPLMYRQITPKTNRIPSSRIAT